MLQVNGLYHNPHFDDIWLEYSRDIDFYNKEKERMQPLTKCSCPKLSFNKT